MSDQRSNDLPGMAVAPSARMTPRDAGLTHSRPPYRGDLPELVGRMPGKVAEPDPLDALTRLVRGRRADVHDICGHLGPATLLPIAGGELVTVDVRPLGTYLGRSDAEILTLEIDVEGTEVEVPAVRRGDPEAPPPDAIPTRTEHADEWPCDPCAAITARCCGSRIEAGGNIMYVRASGAAAPAEIRAE